jgi:hypothetical protein
MVLVSRSAALLFFLAKAATLRFAGASADEVSSSSVAERDQAREGGDLPAALSTPSTSSLSKLAVESGTGRGLQTTTVSDSGTTAAAPLAYGLPLCIDERNRYYCSVGCPSKFYTVQGMGVEMTASTCGGSGYNNRLIVREGPTTTSCLALTCVGT